MQMRIAVKIIITLIIILLILLTSLLIITKKLDEKPGDTTSETTANTEQDEYTTSEDGEDTAGESTEDTDSLTFDTDEKPEDTTAADTTTSPPDPEPPVNTAPPDFTFNETLKSDTGTRLNIRVDLRGENAENGKVKLTAVMYLEYYSIGIGSRSGCRLSVGDASKVFHTEKINETEEKPHTKYLCEIEKICDYGETVSVSARFPFRGVYAGVQIEYLEIDSSVTVK